MYNANATSLDSIWKYNFDNFYSFSILTAAYIYICRHHSQHKEYNYICTPQRDKRPKWILISQFCPKSCLGVTFAKERSYSQQTLQNSRSQ